MERILQRVAGLFLFGVMLVFGLTSVAPAKSANSNKRIRIVPHFAVGQIFRYNIQMLTSATSEANGPIVSSENTTKSRQSVNVVLRIDVLAAGGTPEAPDPVRLRARYDKVAVNSSSGADDPDASKLQKDYQKLQGRSIEFTLNSDGKISDVSGIDDIVADPTRAAAVNQWLSQMTLGASVPRRGITVGEKWSSEMPMENLPLTGLVWKTESSFAQEEPCPEVATEEKPGSGTPGNISATPARDQCAIIHSHSQMASTTGRKDRTPEVYRENGLRTSGEWSGESEALTAISLRTGMVVSVTQSGTTHTDFTVSAVTTGNHVHYTGDVGTEAQITLISETSVP